MYMDFSSHFHFYCNVMWWQSWIFKILLNPLVLPQFSLFVTVHIWHSLKKIGWLCVNGFWFSSLYKLPELVMFNKSFNFPWRTVIFLTGLIATWIQMSIFFFIIRWNTVIVIKFLLLFLTLFLLLFIITLRLILQLLVYTGEQKTFREIQTLFPFSLDSLPIQTFKLLP